MNMNKSKKAKLLSSFAVMAMVVCAFAAVMPVVDGADVADKSSTEKVGGLDISFENSLEAVVSDNKVTFTGSSTAGMIAGDGSKFESTFTLTNADANYTPAAGDYSAVILTGFKENTSYRIIQTNNALEIYDKDNWITGNVKNKEYNYDGVKSGYEFLIPKDGSNVTISIAEQTKAASGEDPAEYGTPVVYTFDFTHVSTKIVLKSSATATVAEGTTETKPWDFSDNTLTLNNYTGSEIFTYAGSLNVELSGKNTITNHGLYDTGKSGAGASAISVTEAGNTLSVYAKDAGATLNIDCCNDIGFGITGTNVTIGKADAEGKAGETTTPVRTVVNIDGGNRAIYATGASNTTTIQNADVIVEGAERGIRTINLTVTDSNVEAKLSTPVSNNEQGVDDYFGIKADGKLTVDAESKVTAQGLRLGGELDNGGIVAVSGNYEQNPDAIYTTNATNGLKVLVAGLYVDTATSVTADRVASADTEKGKIYLIGDAGAFGPSLTVKTNGIETEKTATTAEDVREALATDSKVEIVNYTPSSSVNGIAFTVPADKELRISTTGANTVSGTITTGSGSDAQSITLTNATGSFSIMKGSVIMDGATFGGDVIVPKGTTVVFDVDKLISDVNFTTSDEADVVIKKTHTLDMSTFDITVGKGVTLTIDGKVAQAESSNATISGAGVLVIGSNAQVAADAIGEISQRVSESVMEDQGVTGTASEGTTAYPKEQIITVIDTWTLGKGSEITIEGKLVVPEGCKIVIQAGASLTIKGAAIAEIDGDIVIEAGYEVQGKDPVLGGEFIIDDNAEVSIAGNVQVDGTLRLTDGKIMMDGAVTITEDGVFKITAGKAIVAENGVLTVEGTVEASKAISNYGQIIIDSEEASNGFTIDQMASGAVVDVISFTGNQGNTGVVVTDENLTITYQKQEKENPNANTITLKPVESGVAEIDYTISGVKITTTAKLDKNKNVESSMEIVGDIRASNDDTTTASDSAGASVTLNGMGAITVSENLTLGKNVTVSNAGKLVITGAVDATAGKFTNTVDETENVFGIIVKDSGSLVVKKTALEGEINAAVYKTETADTSKDTLWNYVTIDAALNAAKTNDKITTITVSGEQELTASNDVPAKVTLNIDGELLIGCDKHPGVVLNVDAEGAIKGDGEVTVNGTLFAENGSKVTTTVNSDVKSIEVDADGKTVKNGWSKWTNLATALAEAESGDIITVSTPTLVIKANTTVPEGVTVVVNSDTTAKFVINDGVTFTVNGTVITETGIEAETKFATAAKDLGDGDAKNRSAMIVNGAIKSTVSIGYADNNGDGNKLLKDGAPISGAYYEVGEYFVVSPVAVALNGVADITSKIDVKGEVTVGDIVFDATDDCSVLEIVGKLTASSVTLVGSTLDINGTFNGSVIVGDATVALEDIKTFTVSDVDGAMTFTKTGADADTTNKENASITAVAGKITVKTLIGVEDDAATPTFNGVDFVVASGATVVSEGANFAGKLVIEGTVSVASGKVFTAKDVVVMDGGVLSVDAGSSTTAAGSAQINGKLYVGSATQKETTGAGAAVSGPVSNATQVFVAGGSTMDAEAMKFLKDYKTTEFYVDDALWMTIYTQATSTVEIGEVETMFDIPAENAVFDKWVDEKGDAADKTKNVGDYAKLTAIVTTDIYTVKILANAGINDITIDGNLMAFNAYGGFYYTTSPIAAGTHKVEYTLANGYAGEAKLAINGETNEGVECTTSGMGFTLSGVPKDTADEDASVLDETAVTFQLTGIEKSGYVPDSPDTPAESGMGITDYLLIVLVVLIVVMAIIVAMRLMRS